MTCRSGLAGLSLQNYLIIIEGKCIRKNFADTLNMFFLLTKFNITNKGAPLILGINNTNFFLIKDFARNFLGPDGRVLLQHMRTLKVSF